MSLLAKCRCGTPSDGPCTRLATEEDLLCDVCRPGCAVITLMPFRGHPGSVRAHYEILGWQKLPDAAAGVPQ